MLCPLRELKTGEGTYLTGCRREECEWWLKEENVCAVAGIARALMSSYNLSAETAGEVCEKCKGRGLVWTSQTTRDECPDCGGKGRII